MDIVEVHQVSDELVQAFQRLMPQLSSSSPAPTRAELEDMLHGGASHLLAAYEPDQGGKIVGVLTLVVFRIPTGVRAWIEDVVVDTELRGRGIGEALTRSALDLAGSLGSKTVDLTSRPSREAANRLYQRIGFALRQSNLYRFNLK